MRQKSIVADLVKDDLPFFTDYLVKFPWAWKEQHKKYSDHSRSDFASSFIFFFDRKNIILN
jgi:hypothetical protein